MTADMKSKTPT